MSEPLLICLITAGSVVVAAIVGAVALWAASRNTSQSNGAAKVRIEFDTVNSSNSGLDPDFLELSDNDKRTSRDVDFYRDLMNIDEDRTIFNIDEDRS
ncbi:MAG: hypothetical protein QM673_07030 [Gordonia sp. (in: high G+C Gram-positive bacteria)]